MKDAIRQLDQRFSAFRSLKDVTRPGKGWIRAIRDALGMTTAQFAKRMGVSQPRVIAVEKAEISKAITLKTLERAAEAVGCRVVYALVPDRRLSDIVRERAEFVADRQVAYVEHTMRLEGQSIEDKAVGMKLRRQHVEALLRQRPARLWDET